MARRPMIRMSVSYDMPISSDENLLAATGLGSGDVLLSSGVAKADVARARLPYSLGSSRNCTGRHIEASTGIIIHGII